MAGGHFQVTRNGPIDKSSPHAKNIREHIEDARSESLLNEDAEEEQLMDDAVSKPINNTLINIGGGAACAATCTE